MLPRLLAEERLRAITDGAAAAGALEKSDHRSLIRELRSTAQVHAARAPAGGLAALEAMGIGVRGPAAPVKDGSNG